MKYVLTLTILTYIIGAFEFIRLVNDFNNDLKHGELVNTNTSLTATKNNELQHNVKKLDRKPW